LQVPQIIIASVNSSDYLIDGNNDLLLLVPFISKLISHYSDIICS